MPKDEIDEFKDEVKDEVEANMPETTDEGAEQQTDDYDGLARRIDDVLEKLDRISNSIERVESMYAAFVESGATVRESDDISEATIEETGLEDIEGDDAAEFDIDELDLSL